jgi:hypothetical protein
MFEKRFGVLLSVIILIGILSLGFVVAQDDGGVGDDTGDGDLIGGGETGGETGSEDDYETVEDEDEELIREAEDFDVLEGDGGIGPDSPFYFVDEFLDNTFGNDLENRKERILEMRDASIKCNEGDQEACDAFDVARERYEEHANEFEREVDPVERKKAEESSRLIRGTLVQEIARNVEPGGKDELVRAIVRKEKNIELAAEIAERVSLLCKELDELRAWDEFERVCGEGISKWQKKLYDGLTSEQKKEAKEFGNIMSSCFKTSGRTCNCEGIRHEGMLQMCVNARPLAVECDEGNEDSCDKLDTLEFPNDLPDYLEDVLDGVESEYSDASYDHHIPRPCLDAGITGRGRGDKEKCFEIMIETEAPKECRPALRAAGATNERQAREICEAIMFEQHKPQECVDEGFDNPRDCAKFMKDNFGDFDGRDFDGGGPGPNCKGIENAKNRLACYDGAGRHFEERFEDRRGPGRGFPEPCRKAGALDRDSCEKIMREQFEERHSQTKEGERECADEARRKGVAWDYSSGRCKFFNEDNGVDCAVISCQEGYDCIQGKGCVSDDYEIDDFGEDYEGDKYQDCGPNQFFKCEGNNCFCYNDDSSEFNVETNPNYNPTLGGDGVSCNSGYEMCDGNCVPYGGCTPESYGFTDPNSPSYSTDYDSSYDASNYEEETEGQSGGDYSYSSDGSGSVDGGSSSSGSESSGSSPEPSSEPAAPISGSFITGNAFLDYIYGWY